MKLRAQVIITGADLPTRRLIFRRQAFDGVGDAAVDQFQTVFPVCGISLVTETKFIQGVVQKDARKITGEWSAAGIGTVHARGEADNQ